MHNHTIDWYRQILLTPDAELANKRWETAQTVAKKLSRARIIDLLQLYLFPVSDSEFSTRFTEELITIDKEFPVAKNASELRMMAGLIMATCFENPSEEADSFALGLRAANFPAKRIHPLESESYP